MSGSKDVVPVTDYAIDNDWEVLETEEVPPKEIDIAKDVQSEVNETKGNSSEAEMTDKEQGILDQELHLQLQKLNLDVDKWAMRLKCDAGIETMLALNFVRYETYLLLKQYAEGNEVESLQKLLRINETNDFYMYMEDQKRRLLEIQKELKAILEGLRHNCAEKRRNDIDVRKAEINCRGILQIPEKVWLGKRFDLHFVCGVIDLILQNLSDNAAANSLMYNYFNDSDLLNASHSLALTGILFATPNDFSVGNDMVTPCKHLRLYFPTRAQCMKCIRFLSEDDEKNFVTGLRFGRGFTDRVSESLPSLKPSDSFQISNHYCSTVKYCVLPLVSTELNPSELQFTDEVIHSLQQLERAFNDRDCSSFGIMCDTFYRRFGSHLVTGPLHYGGIFIWKCFTVGNDKFKDKEVRALQDDVISCQMDMYGINRLSEPLCVSGMDDHIPKLRQYTNKLKELTYTQVLVIGGPKKVLGFADWKHGLLESKQTWHLLDRGKSIIPVWKIVVRSTNNYLKSPEKLSFQMKEQWEKRKNIYLILIRLGIIGWFPQKLCLQNATEIREDIICSPLLFHESLNPLHGLEILSKVMGFDKRCRMACKLNTLNSESSSAEDLSGSSEDSIDGSSPPAADIHPMDCLVALLYCSDNIVRQEIFCKMATCQLSVPLLLPHPVTKQPSLLFWALQSIVKEFKPPNKNLFTGRIIKYAAPYVSFVRIGKHSKSKSEILSSVMFTNDKKHDVFFHYNSPGGTAPRKLINGMVDISWYLPSNEESLFSNAVAFLNLHGDACHNDYQRQIAFICNVCIVHVVMVSNPKDVADGISHELLTRLLKATGGVVILQTGNSSKKSSFQKRLKCSSAQFSIVNCDTNIPDISDKLRSKIRKRIADHTPSANLVEIAHRCEITVDEDDDDCKAAKVFAEELIAIVNDYRKKYPQESLKKLLNFQSSTLWHAWAALDKEQYRQENKDRYEIALPDQGKRRITIHEYGEIQRRKMKEIRQEQFEKKMSEVMSKFVTTLSRIEGYVIRYYMLWVKMMLDDLSRDILPPFYEVIREKRNELHTYQKQRNKTAEAVCQEELSDLDIKLVDASFGLEHLLREVSQIYEAVMEQDPDAKEEMSKLIVFFPRIAAKLLFDGFPIELVDGDASHMPQKWISAILSYLSDMAKQEIPNAGDPKIFVLSVLGPQSTGKSTLLNALFGVKFSVSAGRCTRGAFMQLIHVHHSFQEKHGVNFFLLIDTEGLRAPERERLDAIEHDNELATFVIGMANLTLITVSGELTGDINDILHTAVHAFLRMNQVQLKPKCHIIQQHLTARKEDEKLGMDRFRTKRNLDKMTQAAAKQSGLETQYAHFSDVIKFNYDEDVSLFPGLWTGRPPMAHFSTAYIEEVKNLKQTVLKCSSDSYSIDSLKVHLNGLWKAILQEDFVFSFKNTFEIAAYKNLEVQYGEWSWNFKKDMIECENAAQNSLMGCTTEQVDEVYVELNTFIPSKTQEFHGKYAAKMKTFFEQKTNKIALKWEPMTIQRLQTLCENLKCHAIYHCNELYNSRKGRAEADNNKEKLSMSILKRVKELVGTLEKAEMSEDAIEETFEESWKGWIDELMVTIKPLPKPPVAYEVENSVTEFFKQRNLMKFVSEYCCDETLSSLLLSSEHLGLEVKECHVKVISKINGPEQEFKQYKPDAQEHTKKIYAAATRYLSEKKDSGENFKPLFTAELLRIINDNIVGEIHNQDVHILFTEVYYIDLVCNMRSYAIKVFQEMAETFRRKYDPFEYVERELKPYFRKIFIDHYKDIKEEVTATEALCQQLEKPIRECIVSIVNSRVGDEMRESFPWIKTKSTLLARILLEIGEMFQENLIKARKHCKEYLTDAKRSLKFWLHYFTKTHCSKGDPSHISLLIKEEIDNAIKFLKKKAHCVTNSPAMQKAMFSVSDWLKQFHSEVGTKLNLSLGMLCVIGEGHEFPDVNFFMSEFEKRLDVLSDEIMKPYWKITYEEVGITSHNNLYEQVSGCTEQCPFCKAQCELTNENHWSAETLQCEVQHQTQHRPQCLGNFRWAKDSTMMLEVCSTLVAGIITFQNEKTDQKVQPYKKYTEYYPDWSIIADRSLESSLYWKWLIGHYSKEIERMFDYEETPVPQEWKDIKWQDVKLWLKTEYKF